MPAVTVGCDRNSHASLGLVKQNVSKCIHWVYPGGVSKHGQKEWILWSRDVRNVRVHC